MYGYQTHRAAPGWRVLAVVLAVAVCPAVRADGYSLILNPGYLLSRTTTTDETGHESTNETTAVMQRYRLAVENTLYPTLTLLGGGSLDWTKQWARLDGQSLDSDLKQWNGYARLRAGSTLLSGALDYDHQEQDSSSSGTGLPSVSGALLRDTYGGSVSWRPADLPSLDLRLTRSDTHDRARVATDNTVEDLLLTTRYDPTKGTDLRYSLRATQRTDHLADVQTDELANSAAATWSGNYLGDRGTAYVSYTLGSIITTVSAPPTGGLVATAQLPVAGLSVVEVFPALATRVTLAPNSALVDGVTGVSAGLNLGYSGTSPTGERPPRDLGAQFASATLPVNLVYVYVDRPLPDDVAAGFTWTAYRSDDNLDWTQIGGSVTAHFDPLLNRFEIPIERTAARYLKVVTRPLPTGIATTQYAEIFVTEIQFYLSVPAQEAVGRRSLVAGTLNATTKIRLLDSRSLSLAYDLTTQLGHSSAGQAVTYAVTNGLSARRPIGRSLGVAGRLERTDADAGSGHEGINRWSATVSYDPLPTLGGALLYTGQLNQLQLGTATTHTFTAAVRADLYQGVAANANVTYGLARDQFGRHSTTRATTASATVTPNTVLAVAGSVGFTDTELTGGGQPDRSDQRGLIEGSASLTPFRALILSGAVTRIFGRSLPAQTLANFAAAFSPFQGGDLQLRYMYQETLDTTGDQRTRTHGPSLRWNVRRGAYLEVGYTLLDSRAPAHDESSRFLVANLSIALR